MKKSLTKIVMITGATSGIGRATARIFAKKGYQLILTGRKKEKLQEIAEKYQRKYVVEIKTLLFDIRDWHQVKKAYGSLPADWKKIDILINNAGLAKGFNYIYKGDIKNWEAMIDTNIKGLLYVSRLVTPGMVKRDTGHIINISSATGQEVPSRGNVYAATKNAVDSLTEAMRKDLQSHGIRVSQVSPGYVENTEFALARSEEEIADKPEKEFNPLTPRDVADVIYFIATRRKHVNIQDVLIYSTKEPHFFLDSSEK